MVASLTTSRATNGQVELGAIGADRATAPRLIKGEPMHREPDIPPDEPDSTRRNPETEEEQR